MDMAAWGRRMDLAVLLAPKIIHVLDEPSWQVLNRLVAWVVIKPVPLCSTMRTSAGTWRQRRGNRMWPLTLRTLPDSMDCSPYIRRTRISTSAVLYST